METIYNFILEYQVYLLYYMVFSTLLYTYLVDEKTTFINFIKDILVKLLLTPIITLFSVLYKYLSGHILAFEILYTKKYNNQTLEQLNNWHWAYIKYFYQNINIVKNYEYVKNTSKNPIRFFLAYKRTIIIKGLINIVRKYFDRNNHNFPALFDIIESNFSQNIDYNITYASKNITRSNFRIIDNNVFEVLNVTNWILTEYQCIKLMDNKLGVFDILNYHNEANPLDLDDDEFEDKYRDNRMNNLCDENISFKLVIYGVLTDTDSKEYKDYELWCISNYDTLLMDIKYYDEYCELNDIPKIERIYNTPQIEMKLDGETETE